ncbi:hypothetical protein Leryth_000176 [Lithospermum erythrorhizon]|nr:hypothetical protein Leryth_000176 [Lithospermum erythrorhizon]
MEKSILEGMLYHCKKNPPPYKRTTTYNSRKIIKSYLPALLAESKTDHSCEVSIKQIIGFVITAFINEDLKLHG